MPAKVGYLVIDAADPERLAPFWCGLLATGVDMTIGDGEFLVLSPTEDGLTIGFQRVPEAKAADGHPRPVIRGRRDRRAAWPRQRRPAGARRRSSAR